MKSRTAVMCAALVVLISLSGCGGPEERKAEYRLRAQEYFEQGNYPKARVALRNVLKIDPKDVEAYFLYAQVEEKEKNWRNAVAGYQQVVELDPGHARALLKLGKYYLELRAFDVVNQVVDRILAKDPSHAGARALKIAGTVVSGQGETATVDAERLIAEHPTELDAILLIASLYTVRQQVARALPILQRGLEVHPNNIEILNAQAISYIKSGQLAEAESVFRRIITIEPKILDHRVRLAAFLDQQRQYGKAEAVLREAIQDDPQQEQRHLELVEYVTNRLGIGEAETVLTQARKDLPRSTKLQFAMGRLFEATQRLEQARAVYEEMQREYRGKPEALEAQIKVAGLDWISGKQDEAERRIQDVLKENPRSSDALLLRGKIALQRGKAKEATQDFRFVLKDQPEAAEVQLLLGRAYLMDGETALARESLEKAGNLKPNLADVQVLLAGLDAGAGKVKEAQQRIEPLLAKDPGNLTLLGMLFQLQMQEKEWGRSQDTLALLRTAGADGAKADLAEGHVAVAQQQWDKADAAFRRALAQQQDAAEPLMALVQLGVRRGQIRETQAMLESLVASQPPHPFAAGFLGEILLMKGDAGAAVTQFEIAAKASPKWSTPWVHLARQAYAAQRADQGDELLRKALGANPEDEQLRLMLATSLESRDRVDEAITEYETVLTHHPKSLLAANNLAATLVDRKGDKDSLQRALSLSREFESQAPNPYLLDTLGWTHLKLGHRQEALRLIKQAQSQVPDHPVLNYPWV